MFIALLMPGHQVGRPAHRRLRVDVRRLLRAVEDDRLADHVDRDRPGPRHGGVEEAAAGHAGALGAVDVPLEGRVEGHQVAAVDRDRLVLEMQQVDVAGLVGEEHLALAGDPHQRDVLRRHDLLGELGEAAGLLVVEADGALEGDHRALGRQHVGAERDPEHLAVLEHEPVLALLLEVGLLEEVATHAGESPTTPAARPRPPRDPSGRGRAAARGGGGRPDPPRARAGCRGSP